VLYAADRYESSNKIKKWLGEGYIVIADRYASANQIHQGGKIANTRKRENFLKWLAEMEYEKSTSLEM
jgi:dTMP kinase